MQIDLGKIKISWKGPYATATEYEKDDAVFFAGSSYIHIGSETTTGTAPTAGVNNDTWQLMVAGMPTMTHRGEIAFQGANGPEALAAGTSGYVLTTKGDNANPEWAVPASRQNSTVIKLPDTDHMEGGNYSGGVIVADQTIRVWGDGANGNLGQGATATDRITPIMPAFPKTTATVAKWRRAGSDNWFLMSDGSVYVMGRNDYGSLGVGHTATVYIPTKVTALDGVNIIDIAVGHGTSNNYTHAMFLADSGTMYACGYGSYGQLGLGSTASRSTPTALSKTDWASVIVAGNRYGRTFAIDISGNLFGFGYNSSGALGNGNSTNQTSPVQITLPANCAKVSACQDGAPPSSSYRGGHTLALLTDGRVYAWGENCSGQLGIGTNADSSVPQHIASLGTDNADVFAAGGHLGYSVVQKTDGTIRTFGYNAYGQLGDGSTTSRSAPVTPAGVSGHDGIEKILCIGGYSYGSVAVLFEDGTLMVTGYNGIGRLGIGSTTNQTTFQTVPFMKDTITDICCVGTGSNTGLGILTDKGIYYQTGTTSSGQLPASGGNTLVPYPVAI